MSIDADTFKQALSRFPSGVTVVTVQQAEHTHGMTASAFISVSLEPPLVLVSVANKARMHGFLSQTCHFGISFLAADQAAVSNHFAGRPQDPAPDLETLAEVPVIAGATVQLSCELFAQHPAGDHTLFVGKIVAATYTDREPLLYFRGKYGEFSA